MKLSDFSSLVQLGVGLHGSAALFDLVAIFATTPLSRKLSQIESLARLRLARKPELEPVLDETKDMASDLSIQTIHLQAWYRKCVVLSGVVALALTVLLIWLSVAPELEVDPLGAVAICALSVMPVLVLFAWYAWKWRRATSKISPKIGRLEEQVLAAVDR